MSEQDKQIERCLIAIHDLGTREGATAKGVMRQLKKEGFTDKQIAEALKEMST